MMVELEPGKIYRYDGNSYSSAIYKLGYSCPENEIIHKLEKRALILVLGYEYNVLVPGYSHQFELVVKVLYKNQIGYLWYPKISNLNLKKVIL